MYYEAVKTKTYYRSYKGVKKPVNQINLGMASKFKDDEDVIVISKDDFNKLLEASNEDILEEYKQLKKDKKELEDELSKYDDIADKLDLMTDINKLHEDYKDILSDVNDRLYKETQKKESYQNIITDLLSRGLISRMINIKPNSYYLLMGDSDDVIDNDDVKG